MIGSSKSNKLALEYLAPELPGPGMAVQEVELSLKGRPIAPFKASRFTVDPGSSSPLDSHAVHEVWIIAAGEGELVYDGRSHRVSPTDFCYFEPHKSHEIRNDGDRTLTVYSLWWK